MNEIKTFIVNKRFLIILFLGIVTGTMFANFFGVEYISQWGIFDSNFMEKYSSISVNNSDLWKYVLKDRLGDFMLLCIIGFTAAAVPIIMLYLFYVGLGIGLLISISTMQYGFYGIWLYLVSVFPQYLFYVAALAILFGRLKNMRTGPKQGFVIIMAAGLLIICGTYFEAYINPGFLKNVIHNIY